MKTVSSERAWNINLNLKENINNRWKCKYNTCEWNVKYSLMSRSCTEIVVGNDAGKIDWILIVKKLNALLLSVDYVV